jgi:hypothetical protein
MSRSTAATPPLLVFADQELGLWGLATGDADGRLRLATGGDSAPPAAASTGFELDGGEVWQVSGPGHELEVTPLQPVAANRDASAELELCRVAGTVALGETSHEVELSGVRCAALPSGKLDSIRLLTAWFPTGAAVALLAARPQRASGQDKDRISVAVLGEEHDLSVFDPLLSTTYDRRGYPRRSGIEMWLGADAESDQHPRRVAAELAETTPIETAAGEDGSAMRLQEHAMTCISRGATGPGVYLLLRAS